MPHRTQFAINTLRLIWSFCFMSFFTQEVSRTYFRTCLKDHAGVDGQRDNLEVHFIVIGGIACKRDDLMVIFLNFMKVVPTGVLCSALQKGANDYSTAWSHVQLKLIYHGGQAP